MQMPIMLALPITIESDLHCGTSVCTYITSILCNYRYCGAIVI